MKASIQKEVLIFEDGKGRQSFAEWLDSLDATLRGRIENRILRLCHGNYGDHKALHDGVKELRFHFGAGYRVYFAEDGKTIVLLLCGGSKGSQAGDIKKAIGYWKEYKESKNG